MLFIKQLKFAFQTQCLIVLLVKHFLLDTGITVFDVFQNNAERVLLVKQCFVTWLNSQAACKAYLNCLTNNVRSFGHGLTFHLFVSDCCYCSYLSLGHAELSYG